MVTIQKLIAKNDRDIERFRSYIARLSGQQGTRQAVGDFERIVAAAERSNAILRSQLVNYGR